MGSTSHPTMRRLLRRAPLLAMTVTCGLVALVALIAAARLGSPVAYAAPIPPPEGYPKLTTSLKSVTPALAHTGGVTLSYEIEVRNTGAYAAQGATLADAIPASTTFVDAGASTGLVEVNAGTLTWEGDVGFDATVLVTLSLYVDPAFSGTIANTAVLSHPLIARPVSVTAEAIVTDDPILTISKHSLPPVPGANKPLTYTLVVANIGQPAVDLPITVTDQVPLHTSVREVGPDGSDDGTTVTWARQATLDTGEETVVTYSVDVGNVPCGTVVANDVYQVAGLGIDTAAGQPYTVTIVDPVLSLSKYAWPDPPGSNREMTYTLVVRNRGSLATDLEITDRVPDGVSYVRGADDKHGDIVSWSLAELDTNESARFSYVVYVGDVMSVTIVNDDYEVCTAEGVCQPGTPVSHTVRGPTFEASVTLDPIAKKPGGGTGPVTPTLVVRNTGPGNAIDANAMLEFIRISVSGSDLYADPAVGTLPPFPSQDCGDKCLRYFWQGDLSVGETITFTTIEGQSTQGGEEGTVYTATVVVTDVLGDNVTEPVTGTGTGLVTHYANLIPYKRAPSVVGAGQLLTYTIRVWNSGLSTDLPPAPVLSDVLPVSVTLVSVSDGGTSQEVSDTTVISWVLPALSTGEELERSFVVRVDDELISGTQIVNADYTAWWGEAVTGVVPANTGLPVTTTVREIGLIDSYKEVTPVVVLPGPGQVLTYTVHVVNSSPEVLSGVEVYDWLPWESSTYQRDAVASAGTVYSDIVSVWWEGNVGPFSEEAITFTVVVDPDYEGTLVNTARISHPSLVTDVIVSTGAHATEEPVLSISKSASPDPVRRGSELRYTLHVSNLGQPATELVILDPIPEGTTYVPDSATDGGRLEGGAMRWAILDLGAGESRTFAFSVTVVDASEVVNSAYSVACAEGIEAIGEPITTEVTIGGGSRIVYLPVVTRAY
ncbi:MAG: hypothetical protein ACK2UX_16440 [Anaerolineae bacterium]